VADFAGSKSGLPASPEKLVIGGVGGLGGRRGVDTDTMQHALRYNLHIMTDESKDPHLISVPDAIRLKHSLNQSITWGNSNLNALQIEEFTKLTAEDYARIRKEYRQWNANMVSTIALVVLTLSSVVACMYFSNTWVKSVAIGLAVWFFYILAKRDGHAEGYVDGYDAGHEAGIHKALGIKPEELAEMHEHATDMKIDGMLIEGMDEREKKKAEQ